MQVKFVVGTTAHRQAVLAWLKREHEETGEGFYCNATIIEKCFAERRVVCAVFEDMPVAFVAFYLAAPEAGLEIVEVHPNFRKHGLGRRLMAEVLRRLRRRGAKYVNADATSDAGEALCLATGFRPRTDRYVRPQPHVLSQLRYDLSGLQ